MVSQRAGAELGVSECTVCGLSRFEGLWFVLELGFDVYCLGFQVEGIKGWGMGASIRAACG